MKALAVPVALLFFQIPDCDLYPDAAEADDDDAPPSVDCSDTITVPVGPAGGKPTESVDPHAATYGAEPAPFHVHLGLPGTDPSVSGGFVWRTDVDTLASLAEWGPEGGETVETEGASYIFGNAQRVHEVRLCGALQPATTYTYRVGGPDAWSDWFTFTTPAVPGAVQTTRFAVLGDSRGSYTTWASLLALAEAREPEFYVFSGDLVNYGSSQSEWDAWFDAGSDVLARKWLVPAHGNHEFLAQHYFAQFMLPGNEEWFAFHWGPLHLLSLNDTVRDPSDMYTFQTNFIRTEFAASTASWRAVEHHRPLYSSCTTHGSDEDLRDAWGPEFDAGNVDFVFAGHNHIYERSVPIRADAESPDGRGTIYLVAGGAGAPLYTNVEDSWWNAVANPEYHYVIVDLQPGRADVVVRDLQDNVIDAYVYEK